MDLQIILAILGTAGVVSAALSALQGLLDQVPGVIRSWRRVVDEARRTRADGGPVPDGRRSSGTADTPDSPDGDSSP
ncbi:hypothetical protein GCM10010503_10470 [Streptomyces lucensis JCM 4490]|uniref:Uncharacterized protein n=1 Tax=Streptomyces lucensis JCM 4490 TaxID=1306176 RepID=A0A918MMH0_9ACTN|nr:hypothetical protein [Streptomyces lucensis]GGW36473.1 hypothetical protein GCM10010503_10470 [Streptomyces lucensis JCM 4490]